MQYLIFSYYVLIKYYHAINRPVPYQATAHLSKYI